MVTKAGGTLLVWPTPIISSLPRPVFIPSLGQNQCRESLRGVNGILQR